MKMYSESCKCEKSNLKLQLKVNLGKNVSVTKTDIFLKIFQGDFFNTKKLYCRFLSILRPRLTMKIPTNVEVSGKCAITYYIYNILPKRSILLHVP